MELRVEAADGLPDGSCIAVRIGDVQKQTVYDPKKVYRFTELRRFGKIDVYQRMGTCDVVWGGDQPECRVCKVLNTNGDTGTRLKVNINRPIGTGVKPDISAQGGGKLDAPVNSMLESPSKASLVSEKTEKNKEASAAARRYLQEHDVEGILLGATRALLKALPEDAAGFLCHYITSRYAAKQEQTVAVPKAPVAAVTRPAGQNLWQVCSAGPPQFKDYYCKFVLPARGGGYWRSFHETCNWPRPARKPQTATVIREDRFGHKPSVGTWMAKTPRTRKPKVSIDGWRTQAREVLIGASLDGNLDKALSECLSRQDGNPAGVDVEQLLLKTLNFFLQASSDGSLNNVFAEVQEARDGSGGTPDGTLTQAIVNPQSTMPMSDLRAQACRMMIKAAADNTLAQVLAEIPQERKMSSAEEIQKLRNQALSVLTKARADNSLSKALIDVAQSRSDLVRGDFHELKKHSIEILMMASQEGSLARIFESVLQSKQSKYEVRDVCAQACNLLTSASVNGSLAKALTEIPDTLTKPMVEVDALRKKACALLVSTSHDGRLEQAMQELRQNGLNDLDVAVVRERVAKLLSQAQTDGFLEKVVCEIGEGGNILGMQKQTRDALLQGVNDGSLDEVLCGVQESQDVDVLREHACAIFEKAAKDGTLKGALAISAPFSKDVNALRVRACEAFVQGFYDGSLQQALGEVAVEKTTKVSTRFPGTSRQTKAAWSNAPSVSTWNNQRRARPPSKGTAAARS